jgi:hypothetical protein
LFGIELSQHCLAAHNFPCACPYGQPAHADDLLQFAAAVRTCTQLRSPCSCQLPRLGMSYDRSVDCFHVCQTSPRCDARFYRRSLIEILKDAAELVDWSKARMHGPGPSSQDTNSALPHAVAGILREGMLSSHSMLLIGITVTAALPCTCLLSCLSRPLPGLGGARTCLR